MNNKKVQVIAMNAMIAAVYAVLTILISPIAYGAVQMRLTEIIVLLACYNKKFIPGLTIGCLLANLASPMGLYDICFGTAATFIAKQTKRAFQNENTPRRFRNLCRNGVKVRHRNRCTCRCVTACNRENRCFNAFYVFVGEFVVLVIGAILFKCLEKNKTLMNNYILE